MKRNLLGACLGIAMLFGAGTASAQQSTWFRADFNNLNERAPNMYNFANRFAQSATTWQTTHTTNQGWNGTGAPHVQVYGCSGGSGCNTSEHQFNIGWVSPPIGGSRALGDSAFIRFRLKVDADSTWVQDQVGAKFVMFGSTGVNPNSRWIIHLMPPKDNQGCTVGFEGYSYFPWTPPSWTWVTYRDFGLPADFGPSTGNRYFGFQSSVNIGWSCVPSVLIAASNHAAPVPKPQNRGNAPVGGWYHLQFQATSGAAGTADFRIWANNNNQTQPSTERVNMPDGLGVTNWGGAVDVGGYWGSGVAGRMGFIIDDFEIGPTFDPNWYPASGPRPSPVTDVR